MSAILLQPGFGGRYTSETFVSTDTTALDTIDCSHCATLVVQVTSDSTPTGNVDIDQSFDGGVSWAAFISNMAVTDGTISRKTISDGPFGVLRINPTDITGGNVTLTIVGFPITESW